MFHSLPFTPREVKATEARLEAIYAAANVGLKGDALALASGMLPSEFRQLCQLDPMAELAARKGKADGELEAATQLQAAARQGDAKAALAILQHVHGWTARQEISLDVTERISVTKALEQARQRVVEGLRQTPPPDTAQTIELKYTPQLTQEQEGASNAEANLYG